MQQTIANVLSRSDPCRGSDAHEDWIAKANWETEKVAILRACGLGRRHQERIESTSAAWDAAATKIVLRLANPKGSLIFLCGNRGNGKTQLAATAIRHYLEDVHVPMREGRPLYERAMGFYLEIRAAFKSQSQRTELAALMPFIKAGLLVLDEIHVRGETDWENKLLTHMVDCRYADCRHTILISNLKAAEMVASVGPSIADRLRETGGIIECNWPSFREGPTA